MTAVLTRHPSVPQLRDFSTPGYEPPTREYRFGHLRVLALDQALRHTGLVEVTFDGPSFEVVEHVTITTEDDLAGNTAVLRAGASYFYNMRQELMHRMVLGVAQVVVFELPPNPNAMYRPESAMMAALCLKILCEQMNFEHHMVQAQAAKTLWAANPRANKTQLKRGMLEKFPFLKQAMAKATEHEWDALSMALTFAAEGPHG
jgi:Holliday junction resolvasome RuvABC endonuclease subunit